MKSLIGISLHGKTYYFFNALSNEQLRQLKHLVKNYLELYPLIIEKEDNAIIEQFILDANKLLKLHLYLLDIKEILILK